MPASPKPARGSYALERTGKARAVKAAERKEMQAALKRDGYRCRYPGCKYPGLRVDAAHMVHRGMGGNPKLDRTTRDQLIGLCIVHHGCFDSGEFAIRPYTPSGTDGLCSFIHKETGMTPSGMREYLVHIGDA